MSPAEILRDLFLRKKERNPAYSTHAFARDLGVSQTLVSLLLSGKRVLSLKRALQFSLNLGLDKQQTQQLLDAVTVTIGAKQTDTPIQRRSKKSVPTPFIHLEIDRFKTISQWYHVAILDLTTVAHFKPDLQWIAKELGITSIQARDAVSRLTRLGLLEMDGNRWRKTELKLMFPTQNSTSAVREFHKQMIGKAIDSMDMRSQEDFEAREISSMTMAVNPEKITEAKELIRKFQKKLAALLTQGECTALYQFNNQFFPLTKKRRTQ